MVWRSQNRTTGWSVPGRATISHGIIGVGRDLWRSRVPPVADGCVGPDLFPI